MSPPILRCVEVTKQFADRRAVDRLDFAVEPALAVALTRRLAGKIFEIGMLLYGKEPTLTEILRWARSPKSPDG